MSVSKPIRCKDIWEWNKGENGMVLIKKLQEWDAIPKEKFCNQCEKPMTLSRDKSRVAAFKWRCQKKNIATGLKCSYSSSLLSGTLFEGLRISIEKMVCFMIMWISNQSLKIIEQELQLSKWTCVKLSKFFRSVVFDKMVTKFEPIGGEGKTVEIDESKFGKRKYHRGHRVNGQWVLGGYERETGLVFMVPVEKRDRDTLLPIIQKWVKPGTTIHSDMWKAYNGLDTDPNYNYVHLTVNHSQTYKDRQTGACTNGIEGSWRPVKVLYNSSGRRKTFFNGYLAKYMFQKWCKYSNQNHLMSLFSAAKGLVVPSVETFDSDSDSESNDENEIDDD
jgi:transposase-like protein